MNSARLQALLEHDGQRIGLLAGGTTRIPHPQGAVARPLLEQARESPSPAKEVEQPRVAEEVGHADQQFLVEQLDFLGILLEETNVPRQAVELMDAHPPFDAAADRVVLVAGKVVPGVGPQEDEHLLQRGGRFALGQIAIFAGPRDVVDVLDQFGGEFFGRGHVIHQPGVDGAAGHAVILGRGRVLHHGHPASFP